MSLEVQGFGCRPVVTYPPVLRPASESPPGRNPRGLVGRVAVYGDLVGWRLGSGLRRRGRGDQFSGTRDIGLAGGAGEQPVVPDAMEPLWQDVEEEAPDELVGGERHGAEPRL